MNATHDESHGFLRRHVPQLLTCSALAVLSLFFFGLTLPAEMWAPGRGGSLVAIPAIAAIMVVSALTLVASVLCPVVLYLRHRRLAAALRDP